jgi:acetyl-CoA acetyltransferase family protein
MSHPDVFILGGARTPMAEYVGALKDISALDLGAIAARAAMARAGVDPGQIDHVVFGNVLHTSADAIYGARHVGLKAGVPVEVPALTVNRLCGSGIQAAISGAQMIQLREADIVLTGGMESMSQAPHVIRGLRGGLRLGQGRLEDSLWEALTDTHCGCSMAVTAENCASKYGISRQAQDEFALRSQSLAAAAWDAGRLAEEVVPVELTTRKGTEIFARDDHMRPDTTLEGLSRLRAAFSTNGCVTAGNASGIVDGGAALVLASRAAVDRLGVTPLARLAGWATTGVEPTLMGMGPAPATRKLLERTGLALADIDLFEVNEAFAAQYLAVEQELGLPREKVNVNGGAIALGHPLGMSGTRLLLTLALEMRRRGSSHGVAAACIGGGQGVAALVLGPR